MEVKKSSGADLEGGRLTGFLLGLLVSLSVFIAAIELDTGGGADGYGPGLLDDLAEDVEMVPLLRRTDMVRAEAPSPPPALIDNLNVVDDPAETPEEGVGEEPDLDSLEDLSRMLGIDRTDVPDDQSVVALGNDDAPLELRVVERLPEFPGGMSEFMKWLTKTLNYPLRARQNDIEGRVVVSFIVNVDGSVSSPKVVQSASPELDREALRVVRIMPRWTAGESGGKPCRTYVCLPIAFRL